MEWPLFGRDSALGSLTAALDKHGVRGLAIVGEAGVGKTRLAAEVSRAAIQRGRVVEAVIATPSMSSVPFGALAHLISVPTEGVDPTQLMAGLMAEFRSRATNGASVVLSIDDAHHLDLQSAALVHQAVIHEAIFPILTQRPDASMLPMSALWKEGNLERVDIGPLSQQAIESLAEAMLEGPLDAPTLSMLWRRSAGSPLYLRELVLGGLESGAFTLTHGLWHAASGMAPSIRLIELVTQRLGRLSRDERRIIEALGVGGSLDPSLIDDTADQSVLEVLEERNLIEVTRSGNRYQVRLAHPVYQDAVLASMPRTRVRRVMRELAASMQSAGVRRWDDLLRLAIWRLDGGGTADTAMLIGAAERAMAVFDAHLAERLARAAMTDSANLVPALLLLGRALAGQHRVEEGDATFRRATDRARTDDQISRVAIAHANLLYFRAGRIDDAVRVLSHAAGVVTDPDWRDEIASLMTLFQAGAGDLTGVADAGRRLIGRRDARPRAVVHTLVYSSIANVMLGRFTEALEQVRVGLGLASRVRDELPLGVEMLRINGVMANAYAGHHALAIELGGDGHRAALQSGAPEVAAMWGMNFAECQMLAGDVAGSLRTMLGALAVVRDADPFSVHGIDAAVASVCASWLGRHELARELRQEIVDLGLARDVRSRIWFDRATVWTSWAASGPAAAATRAVDAGRRAAGDTHAVWAAWLFHDAIRLGAPLPAVEHLEEIAEQTEGDLVPAMARHARALAADDAIALERAASAFDLMGSHLLAAEAAAQAQQAYLRRGRMQLARVAGARAALLALRCPGVRTPALADTASVPLTSRELEIARLAADGLRSRDIGDRLRISSRTVDNHLGNVYGKLGVAGRADLSAVLGIRSPIPE